MRGLEKNVIAKDYLVDLGFSTGVAWYDVNMTLEELWNKIARYLNSQMFKNLEDMLRKTSNNHSITDH